MNERQEVVVAYCAILLFLIILAKSAPMLVEMLVNTLIWSLSWI